MASHMHYVGTNMRVNLIRAEQTAACTAEELAPLQACMDEACPDMMGIQAVACATMACEAEVDALSGGCGGCLEATALSGAEDAFGPCASVQLPEQYGELPEQPAEECLLETPGWNFEWQRFYTYDAPIEDLPFVLANDRFEFECTFNNSMANPFVRDALAEQGIDSPRDVILGDETLDEMCLFAVTVLFVWSRDIPIPNIQAVYEVRWTMPEPVPEGTLVSVHMHNHGANSWYIGDLRRAPAR